MRCATRQEYGSIRGFRGTSDGPDFVTIPIVPTAKLWRSASRKGGVVKITILNILGGLALAAVVGGLLFGSAGRWDLPLFWAYLGVWAAFLVAGGIVSDPTLAKERVRPGPGGKD